MIERYQFIMRQLALGLVALLVLGCSSVQHAPIGAVSMPAHDLASPTQGRRIAVFFDGTHNDEGSDTNIKRLHSLVSLQDRNDIASIYIQGVGVSIDAIGAATGAGINERVRIGYEFVYNHYRPGDKVYIFGFSRGAYSARQLSAMLYFAGLPSNPGQLDSHELAEEVHRAVFPVIRSDIHLIKNAERWHWARQRLAQNPLLNSPGRHGALPAPGRARAHYEVDVEVLGLWDTVEALGAPDTIKRLQDKLGLREYVPNIDEPNGRYAENLCNVQYAFQALSIDDNRAWIFTPVLISRKHLFEGCEAGRSKPPMLDDDGRLKPGRLQEVWFSGAHSDVGGGYAGSQLSGVSLNWMLGLLNGLADAEEPTSRMRQVGLLPRGAQVRADPFGSTHDPQRSLSMLYARASRNLVSYTQVRERDQDGEAQEPLSEYMNQLCVHESVFQRRNVLQLREYENSQLVLKGAGTPCLLEHSITREIRWPLWHEVSLDTPGCKTPMVVNVYPSCTWNMGTEKTSKSEVTWSQSK